ncbi:hypothetical protein ACFVFS_22450 [Kitasatospora sp. NPDC057692]|uniref:hypothetical protein n=1 Tax=Kitasatospora sp. NPDC057692 TaxID=3346215 RepID=UPI00368D2BCE
MITQRLWELSPALGLPFVMGLIAVLRLLRGRSGAARRTSLLLRDLLTLRMVLRDTEPDQRAELLRAHRAWRAEPRR